MRTWHLRIVWSVGIASLVAVPLRAQPVFHSPSGHYYEYVALTPPPTWDEALELARTRNYQGQRGYLATITNESENAFISNQFSRNQDSFFAWFGGLNVTPTINGERDTWRWGDGPEGGQPFSVGVTPVAPYNYVNWGGIEPNGNRYTMFNLGASFAGIETGEWADAEAAPSDLDPVLGYLVEYGGPPGKTLARIISPQSTWWFRDDGTDQGTNWRSIAFNDATWREGIGEFGYGDGDETTVVDFGPDPNNKYVTTYFRHEFTLGDTPPGDDQPFDISFLRDDAIAVYVNGFEVYRDESLAPNAAYHELANFNGAGPVSEETAWHSVRVEPDYFLPGKNVIAVEVHQAAPNSSDISFNLVLDTFVTLVPEPGTNSLLPLAIVTGIWFRRRQPECYRTPSNGRYLPDGIL